MKEQAMQRIASRGISLVTAVMLMLFSATSMGAADRPIKLKGTSVVDAEPEEIFNPNLPFTTTGTGTHLGKFSGEGFVTFTPTGTDPDDPIIGEGTATFFAANGDELRTEFSGVLSGGHAEITFEIIGGTGRFSDAEGSFQAVAESIPADSPTFSFTANGRISY
jgi:hypothetical protein